MCLRLSELDVATCLKESLVETSDVSDWLAIRPDSSPLLTPNYLTEISLTVESEKNDIEDECDTVSGEMCLLYQER